MITDPKRYRAAIAHFDAAHAEDPRRVTRPDGTEVARELQYAQRMTAWLDKIAPEAPEPVRLAARCQHIRRWERPRSDYPEGRAGYKRWREDAAVAHAELAGRILAEVGYGDPTVDRVRALLRKKKLKVDPDVQLLEDVVCLVFLEHDFADFASRHDDDKLIEIIQKTWVKMSDRGRAHALELNLSPRLQSLVERALAL